MSGDPAEAVLQALWATPLGRFRFADAAALNPLLSRSFTAMRDAALPPEQGTPPFYASGDDLLFQVELPQWRPFVEFMVGCVQRTAAYANQQVWGDRRLSLQLDIVGMWFQIGNGGAEHDVHTHGNCSWSGLYYVQVDPPEQRFHHPLHGARNGVTRFYGDWFNRLGGAFADLGNAYLQRCHCDVQPEEGLLVVFPSWLPHRAMAYSGERDRIVISFNASVANAAGSDQLFGYDAA